MKLPEKILLTFNGAQDPAAKDGADGPILTLLGDRDFKELHLFFSLDMQTQAEATRAAVEGCHQTKVWMHPLTLPDPTDYAAILSGMRSCIPDILAESPEGDYYICVSSGTSQMHACWLLLAAGGEITANVLHVREPRFAKVGQPLITEVNPRASSFPVFGRPAAVEEAPDLPDLEGLLKTSGIMGRHRSIQDIIKKAALAARGNSPILLVGETGTGKERLARFIYSASKRRSAIFLAIDCATISANLLESELFGHERGAFTGADRKKIGKFEIANGGTLLLDEIGDMPMDMQVKLLRVLQEKEIVPVGGNIPKKVDVRIIAATNKDPRRFIDTDRFRQDLFYRLNTITLTLPPLRSRRSDIGLLALHFLDEYNRVGDTQKTISQRALHVLQQRPWPGNIRELKNVIEGSYDLCTKGEIDVEDLSFNEAAPCVVADLPEPHEGFSMYGYMDDLRTRLYGRALEIAGNDQTKASSLLGVTHQAVSKHRKILNRD